MGFLERLVSISTLFYLMNLVLTPPHVVINASMQEEAIPDSISNKLVSLRTAITAFMHMSPGDPFSPFQSGRIEGSFGLTLEKKSGSRFCDSAVYRQGT